MKISVKVIFLSKFKVIFLLFIKINLKITLFKVYMHLSRIYCFTGNVSNDVYDKNRFYESSRILHIPTRI